MNYPLIGPLAPGSVVPALGVSPAREWVQIAFDGSATGKGWVYSSFVSLSGGELPVVEAPPTATPLVTNTIDPTLAGFNLGMVSASLDDPATARAQLHALETLDPRSAASLREFMALRGWQRPRGAGPRP